MKVLSASFLALNLVGLALAQDTNLHHVKHAFNEADIPHDLHIKFNPSALLEVTYVSLSNKTHTLHSGVTLTMNDTHLPPSYALGKSSREGVGQGPFVIAMVDPDSPTPQNPNISQVRHFLGGDFILDDDMGLRNTTVALSMPRYTRPADGSDPHRYIFLLYDQPSDFNDKAPALIHPNPFYFNISQFAIDAHLGDPCAGTFMYVGPDRPPTR